MTLMTMNIKTMNKNREAKMVIHKVLRGDWVEVKYEGKTYLVSMDSLLMAYKLAEGLRS